MENNIFKEINKESLINTCLNRKKIGFELIKEWENDNKHNLNILKNFIDTIFKRIENLLTVSINRFNSITKLFKNLKIELKFNNMKTILNLFHNEQNLKDSNINMNSSLLGFELGLNKLSSNFNKLNDFTNKEIINNILTKEINPYEKNIKILYNKIEPIKKKLSKTSESLIDNMNSLSKIYKETIIKKSDKDILFNSLEFYLSIKNIMNIIINLSNIMIDIWEQSIILDENRNNLIRKSLLSYYNHIGEFMGSLTENLFIESIESLKNINSKKWSNDFFCINKILIEEEITIIKRKIKKENDLELKDIKNYFELYRINFDNFNLKYLIIKEWYCKLDNKEDIVIYLSVDFIFNIYIIMNNEIIKNIAIFKPQQASIKIQRENNKIILNYKESGFFFNKNHKFNLLFKEFNMIEEFIFHYEQSNHLFNKNFNNFEYTDN